jgi:hypothetical protein
MPRFLSIVLLGAALGTSSCNAPCRAPRSAAESAIQPTPTPTPTLQESKATTEDEQAAYRRYLHYWAEEWLEPDPAVQYGGAIVIEDPQPKR